MVNKMLRKNSEEQPLSKKTPKGGRKMATISLMISEQVKGMAKGRKR